MILSASFFESQFMTVIVHGFQKILRSKNFGLHMLLKTGHLEFYIFEITSCF